MRQLYAVSSGTDGVFAEGSDTTCFEFDELQQAQRRPDAWDPPSETASLQTYLHEGIARVKDLHRGCRTTTVCRLSNAHSSRSSTYSRGADPHHPPCTVATSLGIAHAHADSSTLQPCATSAICPHKGSQGLRSVRMFRPSAIPLRSLTCHVCPPSRNQANTAWTHRAGTLSRRLTRLPLRLC